MTEILFYTDAADRLEVAARLCGKAYSQGRKLRVYAADAALLERLDGMLWQMSPTGFLPHCSLRDPWAAETPVVLDLAPEHQGPADVLLNLHAEPPPFFGRFGRLLEIVSRDGGDREAARERFRFYRARGYALQTHSLAEDR
jgi:DNA polymerase-3 subunit chi